MGMSDDEKAAFMMANRAEIEEAADQVFLKLYGRTFRGDADDLARARGLAEIPHAQRNGDSSHVSADSWQKIKADFPTLFGTGDAP